MEEPAGARHNIRINGCKNGLGAEVPTLPVAQCSHSTCNWKIMSDRDYDCAWALFSRLEDDDESLTLRDVERYLKINHERVRSIESTAIKKLKKASIAASTPSGHIALFEGVSTQERETVVPYNDSPRYAMMKAAMTRAATERRRNAKKDNRVCFSEVDD